MAEKLAQAELELEVQRARINALQAKANLCGELAEALRKVSAWARVTEVREVAEAAFDKYAALEAQDE